VFANTRLSEALRDLQPHEQRLVVLIYFEGRTHAEAAEELGIAEGTSRKRLFEIIRKLRDALGNDPGGAAR
jgi:RNA polymerase sigma-70 factor, ECF subfamily